MPINKNALARYKVLDSCFRDTHRYYTIDDLVDEVNAALGGISGTKVSLRQIRQDIRTLRERDTYHAPIVAQIFSFGPHVEVIEPQWFRDQMREKYTQALNLHK